MKNNLIVLFYPKSEQKNLNRNIPLSLLKIGSELKNAGYKAVIIDERFEENYENYLEKILPEILFFGVSSMTGHQISGGIKASSFVKRNSKLTPVVWGGWHPSIVPEETLINQNIDIVVMGQGEATSKELAKVLSCSQDLQKVSGIAYKENGRVIFNRPRQFQDINEFSLIAFDLFDFEKYIFKGSLGDRTIFWNSSQGCPYGCGFCNTSNVYKRRWSGLNAYRLLGEIEILIKKFKIDGITFAEDNFFVDINRVRDLCTGMIAKNIRINWATDARVDQINSLSEEFMELLKKSGCTKLYIGAESGDDDVLNLIDKKIRFKDTLMAAEKLSKFIIISEFFIIVGFPVNPDKDLRLSLNMIKDIKIKFPEHQFTPFLFTPYPGTPLLDLAKKRGLQVPSKLEDWQNWSILTVSTPWINNSYLDRINMYVKCLYPLAFPSMSLRKKFKNRYKGYIYKMLHRISIFRIKHDFFVLPLEWMLIKIFYKIKIKFNLFRNFDSFR